MMGMMVFTKHHNALVCMKWNYRHKPKTGAKLIVLHQISKSGLNLIHFENVVLILSIPHPIR